jgi:hypothetical protein
MENHVLNILQRERGVRGGAPARPSGSGPGPRNNRADDHSVTSVQAWKEQEVVRVAAVRLAAGQLLSSARDAPRGLPPYWSAHLRARRRTRGGWALPKGLSHACMALSAEDRLAPLSVISGVDQISAWKFKKRKRDAKLKS